MTVEEMMLVQLGAILLVVYCLIGMTKYVERGIQRPDNFIRFLIAIIFWPYILKQLDGDKDE